jgi:myo-inositol 2-dehydrogenase/D-chiro-inositol 1-dehydrogenase
MGVGAHLVRNVLRNNKGVSHQVLPGFFVRFKEAFQKEMKSFLSACLEQHQLELELNHDLQATIIGQAISESLIEGQVMMV